MSTHKEILIAGAGPSGLALAVFLSHKGYHPRIVDKKQTISEYSKAFAVNARTLQILDEFGIAKRFLDNGRKLHAINIWRNGKVFFRNELRHAKHQYPFILIQPQKESEEILHEALSERGILTEYGVQFESFTKDGEYYCSTLKNGDVETFTSGYLIGADGARSEVRTQLGLDSPGFGYKGAWELYDVELDVDIPQDDANLFLFNDGGMIMIRVKENLWRVAGNLKDLLTYLPTGARVINTRWTTKFNISHHVANTLVNGNGVLIGDAAHVHSPFGGRGMNLGIEDAYIVSKLIDENKLHEYQTIRRAYLWKTVNRINSMTEFVTADSGMPLLMKKCIWMAKPFFPVVKPMIRRFALGLS